MSATRKAFKYRIYPTPDQQAALAIQFGHARFVYNAALTARKTTFFETGRGVGYNDTAQLLYFWKRLPSLVWLKQADSQVLQQALRDLDRAYQNYFERLKNGILPVGNGKPRKDGMPKGYPRYRSKFDEQSIRYPQRFKVEGSRIYLPKVGWVRAIFHRPLEGQMKNVTVTKTKSGKYFISIQVEVERPEPAPPPGVVGIDLGLMDFATLSRPIQWQGEKTQRIPHPKFLRQAEGKLAALQRKYSRTQQGSRGREKVRVRIARLHEKIANRRADFLHKLSREIADRYGHVRIENLNVTGMVRNHSLAKSIADSGWSEFGRQLTYKAEWMGGFTERIDRWYPSSKTCNACGRVNHTLTLKDRFWVCHCGVEHDRELLAATNIETFDSAGWSGRRNDGGDCIRPAAALPSPAAVGEAGSLRAFSRG